MPGEHVVARYFQEFRHHGIGDKKSSYVENGEREEAATNDAGYVMFGVDDGNEKAKQIAQYSGHKEKHSEFQHFARVLNAFSTQIEIGNGIQASVN